MLFELIKEFSNNIDMICFLNIDLDIIWVNDHQKILLFS